MGLIEKTKGTAKVQRSKKQRSIRVKKKIHQTKDNEEDDKDKHKQKRERELFYKNNNKEV